MTEAETHSVDSTATNKITSLLPENIQRQVQDLTKLLNSGCQGTTNNDCGSNLTEETVITDVPKTNEEDFTTNSCSSIIKELDDVSNVEESTSSLPSVPITSKKQQKTGTKNSEKVESLAKDGGKNFEKPDKLSKDSAKGKRKEDRSIEHVLKALQSLKTPEEKLAALCKKYTDLLEDHRTVQMSYKQSERRVSQMVKEKEQLQTDYSKAILARIRLEGLCRELQKQCKVVKEESVQRIREEEEKRKEVSSKFQTTLTEISALMQENNQKNSVLREENLEIAQKLKSLVEQYELREQHIDKILKHKELELQLLEAKLAKANMTMSEEKEKYLREKQRLLEDLTEYQRRCTEMAASEVQLRAQITMYTDKYSEFQDTLTKSNQVFSSFKGEMEKMSKKIKKLEKEISSWKNRWENSNRALLEMAADKQKNELELLNAKKKIAQLEKLCRAMQIERTAYQLQLKVEQKTQQACNLEENVETELTDPSSLLPNDITSSLTEKDDSNENNELVGINSENFQDDTADHLPVSNSTLTISEEPNSSSID